MIFKELERGMILMTKHEYCAVLHKDEKKVECLILDDIVKDFIKISTIYRNSWNNGVRNFQKFELTKDVTHYHSIVKRFFRGLEVKRSINS